MDIQKSWGKSNSSRQSIGNQLIGVPEIENSVKLVDPTRDALYAFDPEANKKYTTDRPWKKDVNHFKYVRISAVALIKMVMHARSGGDVEVMGLMLGYVEHETFIVTDALRLPVEGTETRVNAQAEADEYMVNYLARSREAGQVENAVGWYHSHPGYGCWLSGIDVATQNTNQLFDPFLAVVIDPHRTISAGKVEIGAFRTYPEGYKPEGQDSSAEGMAAVPMAKAADFGAHANRYYSLEISHYKSTLDSKLLEALWNKYWVQTLSSSPLFTNRDYVTAQIEDLAGKTKQVHDSLKQRSSIGPIGPRSKGKGGDEQMAKVVKTAEKIANEERMGLMAAMVKEKVFAAGAPQVSDVVKAVETNGTDTQMADVKAG